MLKHCSIKDKMSWYETKILEHHHSYSLLRCQLHEDTCFSCFGFFFFFKHESSSSNSAFYFQPNPVAHVWADFHFPYSKWYFLPIFLIPNSFLFYIWSPLIDYVIYPPWSELSPDYPLFNIPYQLPGYQETWALFKLNSYPEQS